VFRLWPRKVLPRGNTVSTGGRELIAFAVIGCSDTA
jgi:hypothetical protein